MKLWRNLEVKHVLLFSIVITVVFSGLGYLLHPLAAALVGIQGLGIIIVFLVFTQRRYQRLADLSVELDRTLHGDSQIKIASHTEGELAILESQLTKLLTRLAEQAANLQQDKIFLSDAMADISHQLRTPLTTLHLIVSLLRQEALSPARRQELATDLQQLLARIDWLVESLLSMAKIDADAIHFKSQTIPIRDLISHATKPLAIALELRQVTVLCRTPAEASLQGDLHWLAEALGNIIKNSMEHTLPGGNITITGSVNPLYTEIIISDDGPGIVSEELPHLFDRFYKGKNACPESIGIGLALARSIIVAQNGTVEAENIADGGARFRLRFYGEIHR